MTDLSITFSPVLSRVKLTRRDNQGNFPFDGVGLKIKQILVLYISLMSNDSEKASLTIAVFSKIKDYKYFHPDLIYLWKEACFVMGEDT